MTGARTLAPRGARTRAAATWQVRSYLAARRPGGFLLPVPSVFEDNIAHLSSRTGLPADEVRSAVRILDERGDVAPVAGRGLMILRGQIAHPDDEGMTARIRHLGPSCRHPARPWLLCRARTHGRRGHSRREPRELRCAASAGPGSRARLGLPGPPLDRGRPGQSRRSAVRRARSCAVPSPGSRLLPHGSGSAHPMAPVPCWTPGPWPTHSGPCDPRSPLRPSSPAPGGSRMTVYAHPAASPSPANWMKSRVRSSRARAWHTACIATAIETALDRFSGVALASVSR